MKFKILLNTFLGFLLIPVILILKLAFPHSFLGEYSSPVVLTLIFIMSLDKVINRERKFLVDYIDQTDMVTFIYLNQFTRSSSINVAKEKIEKVELEKKYRFWRPFDILTLTGKRKSLKFEFKDERFRELTELLSK